MLQEGIMGNKNCTSLYAIGKGQRLLAQRFLYWQHTTTTLDIWSVKMCCNAEINHIKSDILC